MQATPGDVDLGARHVSLAQILVVIAALVISLTAGVVIGRGTAPARSVVVHRETPALTLTGMRSAGAEIRRQVMHKMNSLPMG